MNSSILKKLPLIGYALLLLCFTATAVFASYDNYLRFYLYAKKKKACKEESLCSDGSEVPQAIRVSNGSPYRYRCTGTLKVDVTTEGNTITETLRIDEFINPSVSKFSIRKYLPGQQLANLNTNGIDCTAI